LSMSKGRHTIFVRGQDQDGNWGVTTAIFFTSDVGPGDAGPSDADTDQDVDSDQDVDTDQDTDVDGDTDGDTDADTDADLDSDTDFDFDAGEGEDIYPLIGHSAGCGCSAIGSLSHASVFSILFLY